jgi:hypothetical protein
VHTHNDYVAKVANDRCCRKSPGQWTTLQLTIYIDVPDQESAGMVWKTCMHVQVAGSHKTPYGVQLHICRPLQTY